jgi:hypothetical protein
VRIELAVAGIGRFESRPPFADAFVVVLLQTPVERKHWYASAKPCGQLTAFLCCCSQRLARPVSLGYTAARHWCETENASRLGWFRDFETLGADWSKPKRDKIVAPPVCGGGRDIRAAPDAGVGAKSQKIGRERQARPLLRAQGDGASTAGDAGRAGTRVLAARSRPSPAHLGRERAADARTDARASFG